LHQRLFVASDVESDRNVLGPVRVDEEQAHEQNPLGIECGTGRPVGTDVGKCVGRQPLLLLLLLLAVTLPVRSICRLVAIAAAGTDRSDRRARLVLIGLQKIRHYDV